MRGCSLVHLSDSEVRHGLSLAVNHERESTVQVIAHLAEYQARGLYATDGYPSMIAYGIEVLHYSADAAWRRAHAAATARQYPIIFSMLADGRLHLTAVCLLEPHLTPVNAGELLEEAVHRSRKEVEAMLAARFPRPDVPTRIEPIVTESEPLLLVAASATNDEPSDTQPAEQPSASAPARKCVTVPSRATKPLSAERFALQVTIDRETHDLLRYAQDLLSHQIKNGDVADVLRRVLHAAIPRLEKEKFGAHRATGRTKKGASRNPRHVPRAV